MAEKKNKKYKLKKTSIYIYISIYKTLLCTTSFFPGGSKRFLKNRIFQKSSRQWVRVPGHDMGPGKNIIPKKAQMFFPESFLTYSDRKSISVCCDWGGLIYQSVYVKHQEINHECKVQITKHIFFTENAFILAKGYNHICSASPTKKRWLEEAGAGVKNKIQGAGPFFGRILVDDVQRLALQEKNRIIRSTIHR